MTYRFSKFILSLYLVALIGFLSYSASLRAQLKSMPKTAELQWVVCEDNLNHVVQKLGLKVKKIKSRKVYIWDTAHGDLIEHNWTVRVRDTGHKFSIAAKRNYYQADYNPPTGAKCEIDLKVNEEKVGCSIKAKDEKLTIPAAILKQIQNDPKVSPFLDQVKFWGKANNINVEFKHDIEIELLQFGNFKRIEFSMRVPSEQRHIVWDEWQARLKKLKVKLCPRDTDLGSYELLQEFVNQ